MTDSSTIQPVIGIIGGSGLYDIDGLENKAWRKVSTPWGDPSDELLEGTLGGVRCVFLPRHGGGHPLSPSHLNYRANIDALKRSGCTDVISLSALAVCAKNCPRGISLLLTSLSIAALRGKKASLAMVASLTFPSPIRSVPALGMRWKPPPLISACLSPAAAPTW